MSSKVPKDDLWFGDTSSSESATLVPNSPKIAGQKNPDKEEGALVIPRKATVGENLIIDVKASIQRREALNRRKLITAPPGTVEMFRKARLDKNQRKNERAERSLKIVCS
jgi:hypothetical protein